MITLNKITENLYEALFSQNSKTLGFFDRDIDGYFYFEDYKSQNGVWSSYALRAIADKLDEINKDWDEQIKKLEDE